MIADLLWALPIGLAGGWLLLRAARPPSGGEGRAALQAAPALLVVVCLVVFAHLGTAFRGYVSDIWSYLLVVERIARGQWLFGREPFWLEPPGGPHQSLNWLVLGLLRRWTGADLLWLARLLGLLSIAALTASAWLLATRFLGRRGATLAAALFWLLQPQQWSQVALNRNGALAYFFLALFFALSPRRSWGGSLALALSLALAFYTHLFAGLLTLAGLGLVFLARRDAEGGLPRARLAAGTLLGLALAAPCLLYGLSTVALAKGEVLLGGPGQVRWLGLRWFSALQLPREVQPALLALAGVGLLNPLARRALAPGTPRRYCLLAAAATLVFFFTPLYHLWSQRLGGWLAVRFVALPLLWIPAAGALTYLARRAPRRPRALAAAAVLAVAAMWLGAARVVRDLRHPGLYLPYSAEARAEARALRGELEDRPFLSVGYLSLALAPFCLGKPLWVPPGHASPLHPFEARARLAATALSENSPPCWAYLLGRRRDLEFLITPAPGAADEERLWRRSLPGRSPQEVRRELVRLGWIEPAGEGSHFVLDRFVREAVPAYTAGSCPLEESVRASPAPAPAPPP